MRKKGGNDPTDPHVNRPLLRAVGITTHATPPGRPSTYIRHPKHGQ